MAFEPKEGSGALFKNKTKEGKQPDYRGDVMLAGVVYELAGWIKDSGKGPFLSLSGKPKGDRQEAPRKASKSDDDLIPF